MDAAASQRIARLALDGIADPNRERVLEIGAGTRALTAALVEAGARVTALEIDPELVAILRERDDLRGAEIVEADALEFDFAAFGGGETWHVAGNLPYNVATPLVAGLTENGGRAEVDRRDASKRRRGFVSRRGPEPRRTAASRSRCSTR